MSHQEPRLAWARLNSDGLLIGLLAFSQFFDFFSPEREEISREVGYVPGTLYVWTTLLVLGGLFILLGLLRASIGTELLGRFLVFLAVMIESVRLTIAFAGLNGDVAGQYVVLLIVGFTFALRASVLMAKGGLRLVIGGPDGDR